MDILVSSNVERLLYYITGGNTDEVAGYMKSLAETGKYTLSAAALAKLQKIFVPGYCGDAETEDTIRQVMAENRHLIDTHTAVAVRVLRELHLAGTNIIVSTASAYKFAGGVMHALTGETLDGFDAIDRLAYQTGAPVPAPLEELRFKAVRFDAVIDADYMDNAAVTFADEFDL
jgi:threonine synthase